MQLALMLFALMGVALLMIDLAKVGLLMIDLPKTNLVRRVRDVAMPGLVMQWVPDRLMLHQAIQDRETQTQTAVHSEATMAAGHLALSCQPMER